MPEPGVPIGWPFDAVPTVLVVGDVPLVVEVVDVEVVDVEVPWLPATPTLDGVAVPYDAPTELFVLEVVDVAGGAAWPIPMGFWKVPFDWVLTGAPERPIEEADPPEDPAPAPLPPAAKAGSDMQDARATIKNVSFREAMVRSCFYWRYN